jgi:hypothetical protein
LVWGAKRKGSRGTSKSIPVKSKGSKVGSYTN